MSLYRKYRPHNFANLVGQEHVKVTLMNAFKNGQISHAYLFAGPRGTGKTSTARLIAKALNCTELKDGFEPCDNCDFCKDINEGKLIDVIEIDAASNRGIDEVRDLKEKINFAPSFSQYKVYIIDEVHMMTKEAFNALLKTLEEPPEHAYFILATTEIHKIPETIISRCQRFNFRRIGHEELQGRLKMIAEAESIEASDQAINLLAKYAKGGLRDAIGLLEQLAHEKSVNETTVQEILGISGAELMEQFANAIEAGETDKALKLITEVYDQGTDLKNFGEEFVELMRERMLERLAAGQEVAATMRVIEMMQEAKNKIDMSFPQLSFEIAIVKLTYQATKSAPAPAPAVKTEAPIEKSVAPAPVKEPEAPQPAKVEPEPVVEEAREHRSIGGGDFDWQKCVAAVKNPALRMSLKNAKFLGIEGIEIRLEFGTQFHHDQVMGSDNRGTLEGLISDLAGKSLKLKAAIGAGPAPAPRQESVSAAPVAKADGNITDDALEIFGGELI